MYEQLFGQTVTVAQPQTAPAAHNPLPPRYTVNEVAGVLARLLETPIGELTIAGNIGRMVLVHYTPVLDPDPDIILMMGTRGGVVNRAVLDLQKQRDYPAYYTRPGAWYNLVDRAVARIAQALVIVAANPAESAFVMDWARAVRDRGRITPPRMVIL